MLNKEIKFVSKKLNKTKFLLIVLCFTNIVMAILGVISALFTKEVVDSATGSSKELLITNAIILVCIFLLQIVISLVSSLCSARLKYKTKMMLERDLFKELVSSKNLSFHSGDYLNRYTSDINYITDGVVTIIPKTVFIIAKFIAAFIAIAYIDFKLVILLIIFGVFFVVFHFVYRKFLAKWHKLALEKEAVNRIFVQECLTNHEALTFTKKQESLIEHQLNTTEEVYCTTHKRARIQAYSNVIFNIGMIGSYTLLMIYASFQIFIDVFEYGDFVALLQLFNQITSPLTQVATINTAYIQFIESTKRFMCIYDTEKIDFTDKEFKNQIELTNIGFKYLEDEDYLFKDVNLVINKNDIITIKGESGIGKSTLIKVLVGKLKPSEGTISIDNNDPNNYSFGYVSQQNFLLSGTIKDTITLYDENITDEHIIEVLKICCLDEFINQLDKVITEVAGGISIGQSMRLSLARALLLDRDILLLDEISSALDTQTEDRLLNNLKQLNKTIIFISHKNATNKISNKIYEIKNKRLVEEYYE